ncbi:MAG: AtpZ/AtpI family protein [Bacillota bacterium]|nr:AtpZ/AtpI family protein [Bacillota bacterium]
MKHTGSGWEALALFGQLGLTVAVPIILGALAGRWIDQRLGTFPLFLAVLILLGTGAGILGAYHQIGAVTQKKKDRNERGQ